MTTGKAQPHLYGCRWTEGPGACTCNHREERGMSDELDDFEYAFTRRAIRQIKAEAWDEGYDIAIRDSYLTGGHGKSPNPHRKES